MVYIMKRYQVYLNPQSVSVLDELSKVSDLTRSQLIREAVEGAAARVGNLLALFKAPNSADYLKAAPSFHQTVLEGSEKNLRILEIGQREREMAWEKLHKYSDHKLSFTDATIIANFEDFRLDEIFTFDGHFRDINLPARPAGGPTS